MPVREESAAILDKTFSSNKLQVIVKLANIHLTPEAPTYDGGCWHIEYDFPDGPYAEQHKFHSLIEIYGLGEDNDGDYVRASLYTSTDRSLETDTKSSDVVASKADCWRSLDP